MDKFNCMYGFEDYIETIKRHDGSVTLLVTEDGSMSEVVLSHADAKALAERLTDICRGVE